MFVLDQEVNVKHSSDLRRFDGMYQLLPEHNQFETGAPPQSGTFSIKETSEGLLTFRANWVTTDGRKQQMLYSVRPDGKEYPNDNPVIADRIMTTLETPYTVVTVKKKAGHTMNLSRIVLSTCENELRLIQSGYTWNGKAFTNIALFHRK